MSVCAHSTHSKHRLLSEDSLKMMAEQLKPANHLRTSLIFLLFKLFQFFSSFYIPLTRPKLAEIWFSSEKRVCTLSPAMQCVDDDDDDGVDCGVWHWAIRWCTPRVPGLLAISEWPYGPTGRSRGCLAVIPCRKVVVLEYGVDAVGPTAEPLK